MEYSRFLNDYPDVLLPEECMSVLSVGKNTIYDLLQTGKLKSIRVGKQYRIPKKCLQIFLRSCYTVDGIGNSASTDRKESGRHEEVSKRQSYSEAKKRGEIFFSPSELCGF